MEHVGKIKPEKLSVRDYTRESILGFLKWLEEERGNSVTTRNYRLSAMKGFVHYLKYEFPDYMEEYQRILGIPLKKTEQKANKYCEPNFNMPYILSGAALSNKNPKRQMLITIKLVLESVNI